MPIKAKRRTGFAATDDIVNKIIRSSSGSCILLLLLIDTLLVSVTVQTGLLTSMFAAADIIAYLVNVSLFYPLGPQRLTYIILMS